MEIAEKIEETAREFEERVRPQLDQAKKRLGAMNDEVIDYIKANPGKCLLGALAVGYIIGRIARR
ncbi:MAG TPA: hypothetical protein VMU50_06135 [Polyangia bacterium]|jgi:ElaB/YqjD/DUF883 family membrane-anchored ribosome-binding protein|nr:hypothetical protein [Polyangia bacterium]